MNFHEEHFGRKTVFGVLGAVRRQKEYYLVVIIIEGTVRKTCRRHAALILQPTDLNMVSVLEISTSSN